MSDVRLLPRPFRSHDAINLKGVSCACRAVLDQATKKVKLTPCKYHRARMEGRDSD